MAAQPANNPIVQVVCQPLGGGITMFYDNPVIVIPPFKVVRRMCERSQAVGTPAS